MEITEADKVGIVGLLVGYSAFFFLWSKLMCSFYIKPERERKKKQP